MCYTVKSIEDVRGLVVATRGLSGLSDTPTLIVKAARRMAELVQTDMVAVALHDGDDLVVGSSLGTVTLDGLRLTGGGNLGGRALRRDMATTTGRCGEDADADALARAVAADGMSGLAAVPLTFEGAWLGVLYAGMRGRRASPRTTLLLTEFAASLAPLVVAAVRAERAGRIAVQEERGRIAQDLHDTAGQLLFRIALSAEEIRRCADADPESTRAAARSIEVAAAEASGHLRQAMHSLLPADDALPVLLRRDVTSFAARSGLTAELVTLGEPVPAGADVEGVLVAVLREALHNVEKHAGAEAVLVSLSYRRGEVCLSVQDDGKGLPAGFTLNPVPGGGSGLGLPGLLQRAVGVGGALTLVDDDDGGTGVRATVPLREPACRRGDGVTG